MPDAFRITLHFPSRRWTSGSHIEFEFSELGIIVETGPKRTQHVAGNAGWTGHGGRDHALAHLFLDEGIKGDAAVERAVEGIWSTWRADHDPSASNKAQAALQEFQAWIAAGAKRASSRWG